MFLFGSNMFLFGHEMFLFGNDMFHFENDMFLFRNDMFLFGNYMFLWAIGREGEWGGRADGVEFQGASFTGDTISRHIYPLPIIDNVKLD